MANYFKLISQCENGLGSVPEDERTPQLCSYAVKNNSFNLLYVPDVLRTKQLCYLALKDYYKCHYIIKYLPQEYLKDFDFCCAILKRNSKLIKYICLNNFVEKQILIFYDIMCKNIRGINYIDLKYIDSIDESLTNKICQNAINMSPFALQYIPQDILLRILNPEMCVRLVKQSYISLKWIPQSFQNNELYKIALQYDVYSLQFVSKEIYSQHILLHPEAEDIVNKSIEEFTISKYKKKMISVFTELKFNAFKSLI